MPVVRIQTGATEPIEVIAVDALNQRLVGLTDLKVQVRRVSNDWLLDWADSTFRASPVQPLQVLQPIDPTLAPGEYRLNSAPHIRGLNTDELNGTIDDETYRITVIQDAAIQTAANFPQIGEIKVGDWVDYIDQAISENTTEDEVRAIIREFGLDHLVSVNPGVVPPAAGTYIRQLLDRVDAIQLTLDSAYSLQQSYSYNQGADALTGQVWLESSNLVVATPTSCTVTWYQADGIPVWTEAGTGPDAQGVFKIQKVGPSLSPAQSYYAIATVIVSGNTVTGAKGIFTVSSS
jgi:hypothetical protein